jgi:sarcosine oxidase subunit alpha
MWPKPRRHAHEPSSERRSDQPRKPLSISFNSQTLTGFEGDTPASTQISNGVRVVGRSFKYHRPRGIFSAGSEEPNALMAISTGAEAEPNTRATMVELREGLVSFSQNHMGSLNFDLLAVSDLLSPFLSAGF